MNDPKLKSDTLLLWGAAAVGALLLWRGSSKASAPSGNRKLTPTRPPRPTPIDPRDQAEDAAVSEAFAREYESATRPPTDFGGDIVQLDSSTHAATQDDWGEKWALFQDAPPPAALGMRRGNGPEFLVVTSYADKLGVYSSHTGFTTLASAVAHIEDWETSG